MQLLSIEGITVADVRDASQEERSELNTFLNRAVAVISGWLSQEEALTSSDAQYS